MNQKKSYSITPVKGRPMLQWVGKRPLNKVQFFPAQVCETVGVSNPPDNPTYREFRKSLYNLLFHGDNKEILSTLLTNGFRGNIDLIYIDPPFDSGADYVRNVSLRGNSEKLSAENYSLVEQVQYEDIWAHDNYLQFMYERLILLKELLSDEGSIYLHCNEIKNSHLRILMDEVFGADNFKREVIWDKTVLSGFKTQAKNWIHGHDSILFYAKTARNIFNRKMQPHTEKYLEMFDREDEGGKYLIAHGMKRYLKDVEKKGKPYGDVWDDIKSFQQQPTSAENLQYPTQKPKSLLERIIKSSSNENSIVLDCFCGSGTTAAVAEELGRRWIMVDINKGAIQTTVKRLQTIIRNNETILDNKEKGLVHYKVNNYEITKQHELKKFIVAKYGIQTTHQDLYFDGLVGGHLAKVIDLNRPLNRLDLQLIKDEIQNNRPDETRNVHVFCNGSEIDLITEIEQDKTPINKFVIQDVQQDGLITSEPVEAEIEFTRVDLDVTVKIVNFIDPTILSRLNIERTLFNEQVDDFRAQIDYVLIDTDYTNNTFKIVHCDFPSKKSDYVNTEYKLNAPRPDSKIAMKIVSMLGEEFFEVFK